MRANLPLGDDCLFRAAINSVMAFFCGVKYFSNVSVLWGNNNSAVFFNSSFLIRETLLLYEKLLIK